MQWCIATLVDTVHMQFAKRTVVEHQTFHTLKQDELNTIIQSYESSKHTEQQTFHNETSIFIW
jgi:hypothetical protein